LTLDWYSCLLPSASQKFLLSTKPTEEWGPSEFGLRESWLQFKRRNQNGLELNDTGKRATADSDRLYGPLF
jgi:hypothetical protein